MRLGSLGGDLLQLCCSSGAEISRPCLHRVAMSSGTNIWERDSTAGAYDLPGASRQPMDALINAARHAQVQMDSPAGRQQQWCPQRGLAMTGAEGDETAAMDGIDGIGSSTAGQAVIRDASDVAPVQQQVDGPVRPVEGPTVGGVEQPEWVMRQVPGAAVAARPCSSRRTTRPSMQTGTVAWDEQGGLRWGEVCQSVHRGVSQTGAQEFVHAQQDFLLLMDILPQLDIPTCYAHAGATGVTRRDRTGTGDWACALPT